MHVATSKDPPDVWSPRIGLRSVATSAATLVGVTAFLAVGRAEGAVSTLIVAALAAVSVKMSRPDSDPLLRGIGGVGVVLCGQLLVGPLVDAVVPEPTYFGPQETVSPTAVVMATYLPVVASFVVLAWRRYRAGAVGLGIVVPIVLLTLLAAHGAKGSSIGAVAAIIGSVALVAALVAGGRRRVAESLLVAAGGMSGAAIGAAALPIGSLSGSGTTDAFGGDGTVATIGGGVFIAGLSLALATCLVAGLRRTVSAALVAAIGIVPLPFRLSSFRLTEQGISLGGVLLPLGAALVAAAVAWSPALRERMNGVVARIHSAAPVSSVAAVAACAFCGVIAALYVSLGVRPQDFHQATIGISIVLVGVTLLGWRLRGVAGTTCAVLGLLGLAWTSPIIPAVAGRYDRGPAMMGMAVLVGVVFTVGSGWLAWRRHQVRVVAVAATFAALSVLTEGAALMPSVAGGPLPAGLDRVDVEAVLFGLPTVIVILVTVLGAIRVRGQRRHHLWGAAASTSLLFGAAQVFAAVLPMLSDELRDQLDTILPSSMTSLAALRDSSAVLLVYCMTLILLAGLVVGADSEQPSALAASAGGATAVAGALGMTVAVLELSDVDLFDKMLAAFAVAAGAAVVVAVVRWGSLRRRASPAAA